MAAIRLIMPRCGEDGVIIATRLDDQVRVEFRGKPYSQWEVGDSSPMIVLLDCLIRVDISALFCAEPQVVTPWHEEWDDVNRMFNEALVHV